jgi:predicted  nucleic acid-binding Zn-ribbon protein
MSDQMKLEDLETRTEINKEKWLKFDYELATVQDSISLLNFKVEKLLERVSSLEASVLTAMLAIRQLQEKLEEPDK